jgi:hypothetical protein
MSSNFDGVDLRWDSERYNHYFAKAIATGMDPDDAAGEAIDAMHAEMEDLPSAAEESEAAADFFAEADTTDLELKEDYHHGSVWHDGEFIGEY